MCFGSLHSRHWDFVQEVGPYDIQVGLYACRMTQSGVGLMICMVTAKVERNGPIWWSFGYLTNHSPLLCWKLVWLKNTKASSQQSCFSIFIFYFGYVWYQTFSTILYQTCPTSWDDRGERPAQVNRVAKTSGSEETRWTPLVVQVKGLTCVIWFIDLLNINLHDPVFLLQCKVRLHCDFDLHMASHVSWVPKMACFCVCCARTLGKEGQKSRKAGLLTVDSTWHCKHSIM